MQLDGFLMAEVCVIGLVCG